MTSRRSFLRTGAAIGGALGLGGLPKSLLARRDPFLLTPPPVTKAPASPSFTPRTLASTQRLSTATR